MAFVTLCTLALFWGLQHPCCVCSKHPESCRTALDLFGSLQTRTRRVCTPTQPMVACAGGTVHRPLCIFSPGQHILLGLTLNLVGSPQHKGMSSPTLNPCSSSSSSSAMHPHLPPHTAVLLMPNTQPTCVHGCADIHVHVLVFMCAPCRTSRCCMAWMSARARCSSRSGSAQQQPLQQQHMQDR